MLVVDLNRLQREGRARIEADIGTEAPFWHGTDVAPTAPLEVRLEAQQAGPDVVVRGRFAGAFALECRRCLEPVTARVEEDVGLLYRAASGDLGDEPPDVLPLPRRASLDVTEPVREHVLVSVPRYAQCRSDCRGLCPVCGTNRNESVCDCVSNDVDDRWAPLRRLRVDE